MSPSDVAESLTAGTESDEDLLRLATRRLREQAQIVAAIEEIRDDAALRMRERGVPMVKIAVVARVSDSYLGRRLFRRGAPRRVIRA